MSQAAPRMPQFKPSSSSQQLREGDDTPLSEKFRGDRLTVGAERQTCSLSREPVNTTISHSQNRLPSFADLVSGIRELSPLLDINVASFPPLESAPGAIPLRRVQSSSQHVPNAGGDGRDAHSQSAYPRIVFQIDTPNNVMQEQQRKERTGDGLPPVLEIKVVSFPDDAMLPSQQAQHAGGHSHDAHTTYPRILFKTDIPGNVMQELERLERTGLKKKKRNYKKRTFEEAGRSRKRKGLACDQCRLHKVRCVISDGQEGLQGCQTCGSKNKCTWLHAQSKKGKCGAF